MALRAIEFKEENAPVILKEVSQGWYDGMQSWADEARHDGMTPILVVGGHAPTLVWGSWFAMNFETVQPGALIDRVFVDVRRKTVQTIKQGI